MLTKRRVILIFIIIALIIAVPILALTQNKRVEAAEDELQLVTLWQIDGFEGGKGSRAKYLGDKSKKMFGDKSVYLNVVTLTATAAEENIKLGNRPDMISCSPTFNAHLNLVENKDFTQKAWCYGSYFLLSLEENARFDDVTADNLIVNSGKDNLVEVAAVLCGVEEAKFAEPTNAYLQLINGKYKYLLGTQRDVYRLKTRELTFSAKQITEFNDLYQIISITTGDKKRYETCRQFVEYILSNNDDVSAIGMYSDKSRSLGEVCPIELSVWKNTLSTLCSENYISEIKNAAANKNLNKIKNLLK